LLIGCDYLGTDYEAPNCSSATLDVKDFLEVAYGVKDKSVRVLLDDQATVINILNGISWLTAGARPGDSLVFFFSGHGSQQRAPPSGRWSPRPFGQKYEDTIVPSDFLVSGQISDTVLLDGLAAPLPAGVQLIAFFDCCHRALSLDLPYRWCGVPDNYVTPGLRDRSEKAALHVHPVSSHSLPLGWEVRNNAYYVAADVVAISCCERWQCGEGARRQELAQLLREILSRSDCEPSFPKLMRHLDSPFEGGWASPPHLVSSQAFDFASKRFNIGGDMVPNMNQVLGRQSEKLGGDLEFPGNDPLVPSALWGGAKEDTQVRSLSPLPQLPALEFYQSSDGTVYNGEWRRAPKGFRTGSGGSLDLDGQLYVGQWNRDLQDGVGEQVWPDGTRYEGTFAKGVKHGHGRIWWSDGAEYLGDIKEDKLSGEGMYRWPDGRKYRGQWANNTMDGRGIFTWKHGQNEMFDGEYQAGQKHGEGVLTLRGGKKVRGQWHLGELRATTME
jgi:hypothetical protein